MLIVAVIVKVIGETIGAGTLPTCQVIILLETLVVPTLGMAFTNVTPAGNISVITSPETLFWPSLLTVSVNIILLPLVTVAALAVCESEISVNPAFLKM